SERVLRNNNTTVNKGGTFYIGYFQDDLGEVQAYDLNVCQWKCDNRVYGYTAFEAEANEATDNFTRYNIGQNYKTYGLNLEVSAVKDNTNYLVQRAADFDTLIGYKMAAKCIEYALGSTRKNADALRAELKAANWMADLEGLKQTDTTPYVQGINGK